MFRSRLVVVLACILAAGSEPAHAQHVSIEGRPWFDRFSFEPYAGMYVDNAGEAASGFDETGWLGGLRVGLGLSDRVRLLGDVGYSRVDRADRLGGDTDYAVFDSESWLVSGGIEVDMVPGDTRGALSLQGGGVWRDLSEQERVGDPAAGAPIDGYSPALTLVPGFVVHQYLTPRADLSLGVRDYILFPDGDAPTSHNFALTAGITLR